MTVRIEKAMGRDGTNGRTNIHEGLNSYVNSQQINKTVCVKIVFYVICPVRCWKTFILGSPFTFCFEKRKVCLSRYMHVIYFPEKYRVISKPHLQNEFFWNLPKWINLLPLLASYCRMLDIFVPNFFKPSLHNQFGG